MRPSPPPSASVVELTHTPTAYTRRYSYDGVGNVTETKSVGQWTRTFSYASTDNRLASTTVSGTTTSFAYTHRGAMTSMPHLAGGAVTWDEVDHIRTLALPSGNSAHYTYDATRERVRKVIEKGAITEERIYLGSYEIYRKYSSGTLQDERHTLHVHDPGAGKRVLMVERLTLEGAVSKPGTPRYRYQLGNHLGTAAVETDETGDVITYEEFYPYGGLAWTAEKASIQVSAKRYRYIGKERDEESGLNYHSARYYMPWLGRWCSADPGGLIDGVGRFGYAGGRPVGLVDLNGLQPRRPRPPGPGGPTQHGTYRPQPTRPNRPNIRRRGAEWYEYDAVSVHESSGMTQYDLDLHYAQSLDAEVLSIVEGNSRRSWRTQQDILREYHVFVGAGARALPGDGARLPAEGDTYTIYVRYRPGMRWSDFHAKTTILARLGQEGRLIRTTSSHQRARSAAFRRELKALQAEFEAEGNPLAADLRALLESGQIDHLQELQMSGADLLANLALIQARVNSSIGAQIQHQLKNVPNGSRVQVRTIVPEGLRFYEQVGTPAEGAETVVRQSYGRRGPSASTTPRQNPEPPATTDTRSAEQRSMDRPTGAVTVLQWFLGGAAH